MPAISTANDRDKSKGATFDVDDSIMSLIHQRTSIYDNYNKSISESEQTIAMAETECSNVNSTNIATISTLSESGLPMSELQFATKQINEVLEEVNNNQRQIDSAMAEIDGINSTNNYLIIGIVVLLVVGYLVLFR